MVEMDLWTATQIADKLGEPPQRACYIIRKYRLKPVQHIGIIRLFGEDHISTIKRGLYGIQIRGGGKLMDEKRTDVERKRQIKNLIDRSSPEERKQIEAGRKAGRRLRRQIEKL